MCSKNLPAKLVMRLQNQHLNSSPGHPKHPLNHAFTSTVTPFCNVTMLHIAESVNSGDQHITTADCPAFGPANVQAVHCLAPSDIIRGYVIIPVALSELLCLLLDTELSCISLHNTKADRESDSPVPLKSDQNRL